MTVTDYEGYGQTTTPTYITGRSEGPAVLDSIRAAQRLDVARLSPAAPVAITGYSQGGGASMWAAEYEAGYAPELNVVGATAGGIPADLAATAAMLNGNVGAAFLFMAAIGLDAAYPELKLSSYLNDAGRAGISTLENGCQEVAQFIGKKITDYTTTNPLDSPAWKARIAENKLGGSPPTGFPVFMFHGGADEIIPLAQSQDLYNSYCKAG